MNVMASSLLQQTAGLPCDAHIIHSAYGCFQVAPTRTRTHHSNFDNTPCTTNATCAHMPRIIKSKNGPPNGLILTRGAPTARYCTILRVCHGERPPGEHWAISGKQEYPLRGRDAVWALNLR